MMTQEEDSFGFNERSIIAACATMLEAYRLLEERFWKKVDKRQPVSEVENHGDGYNE